MADARPSNPPQGADTGATPALAGPWHVLPGFGSPATHAWPLHERAAAQAAEARALAGAEPFSLMSRAGQAVARLARALTPHAQRVWVLVGPGNNGGDGLVAARWLHQAGLQVQVLLCADPPQLPADAARAWREAGAAGVPMAALSTDDGLAGPGGGLVHPPELLIDALLGLGAQRAPSGPVAAALALGRSWAARGVPVLAVDLPSGLHPDTGQPLGSAEQLLPATATLCLLTLRPGCFTGRGRDLAGQVWFDDLGYRDAVDLATAWLGGPGPPSRQHRPDHAAHKGTRGDVAVVGGAPGMDGAAWLAASAALSAGAGRVYVSLLDDTAGGCHPARPELMRRRQLWAQPPAGLQQTTVVAGCGGGLAMAHTLPPLLAHAGRLVLDADALNALAQDTALQTQLQHRSARGAPTVLTPHPLEAARLLGLTTAAVQADRLSAARTLARHFKAEVVLKGSGSVLASPSGQTTVNPSGNASLATAGTGDVLAGWLGGHWAQAAARALPPDALHALVARCVWQHGAAADHHRASGHGGPLLAAELVDALRAGAGTG